MEVHGTLQFGDMYIALTNGISRACNMYRRLSAEIRIQIFTWSFYAYY